jgi:replicative DNA helicase
MAAALTEVAQETTDGGIKVLSKHVINDSIRRSAGSVLEQFRNELGDTKEPIDVITRAMDALVRVANEQPNERLTTCDVAAREVLEALRNPSEKPAMVKTYIESLDGIVGGLQNGLLTVISGRPSMGKSTFIVNVLLNMALAGHHVYMGSLEDRTRYVTGRMLARLSNVNSELITKGLDIGLENMQAVEAAVERSQEALSRIHIDDSSGQDVMSIRRTCDKLKGEDHLDVAFIDHLGEMKKYGSVYEATTKNVEGLRDIANDIDIPVIAGHQVSRSSVKGKGLSAKHEDFIPTAADLRDSGRIEEVARNIWFVHRPFKWDKTQPENDFWVVIDKATHGRTGTAHLKSNLSTMSIASHEHGENNYGNVQY